VAAGKAYSISLIRRYLRRGGISRTIAEKSGSQAARRREGSGGGRPPGSGAGRCKRRSTAGRAISKLRRFRAVATRCGKRCCSCLGTTTAAALVIWLRS
jgi:transposase